VAVPGLAAKMTSSVALKFASMVVVTVPIMCVYPFLQKYFVKGIMIGAVKG
jgi:putative aldouronate transport system permease protein